MLGLLAHGFHLLLLVLGLAGVLYLLFPQVQAATRSSRRTTYRAPASPSEHEQRVAELRASVLGGQLTTADQSRLHSHGPAAQGLVDLARPGRRQQRRRCRCARRRLPAPPRGGVVRRPLLPRGHPRAGGLGRAWCSSTRPAAACSWPASSAASGWSPSGRSRARSACPFGLGREPVGGWDIACAVWELVDRGDLRGRTAAPQGRSSAGDGRPRAAWRGPGRPCRASRCSC